MLEATTTRSPRRARRALGIYGTALSQPANLRASCGGRILSRIGQPAVVLASALSLFVLTASSLPAASAALTKRQPPTHSNAGCSRIASPGGSDRSRGSLRSPYRTFKRLMQSLRPGMIGCLRAGTYGSPNSFNDFRSSGTSRARITLRSYPGETATIQGYTGIDGSYVKFATL